MRAILIYAFLCGILAVPMVAQSKVLKEKLTDKAKPYIEAALNTPMNTLTAKVLENPDAKDHAFLGLAMLAGRHQPEDGQEAAYAQKLVALETRLLPQSDDYLETHPGVDFQTIDWVGELKPTPAELLVAVYYQQRYLADYWLGLAMIRRNMPLYEGGRINVMGTGRMTSGGRHPVTQSPYHLYDMGPVLKRDVLMTAAACVRSVRIDAGLSYRGPRELPAIVILMRKFPYLDIDNTLPNDEAQSMEDNGYATGADACGTAEQFQMYVETLKKAERTVDASAP